MSTDDRVLESFDMGSSSEFAWLGFGWGSAQPARAQLERLGGAGGELEVAVDDLRGVAPAEHALERLDRDDAARQRERALPGLRHRDHRRLERRCERAPDLVALGELL